jgi:hypothetical protein
LRLPTPGSNNATSISFTLPTSASRIDLWDSAVLLRNLNATRAVLAGELADLRSQCNMSLLLLESVLAGLGAVHGDALVGAGQGLARGAASAPLGFNINFGTDELFSGLGFACRNF